MRPYFFVLLALVVGCSDGDHGEVGEQATGGKSGIAGQGGSGGSSAGKAGAAGSGAGQGGASGQGGAGSGGAGQAGSSQAGGGQAGAGQGGGGISGSSGHAGAGQAGSEPGGSGGTAGGQAGGVQAGSAGEAQGGAGQGGASGQGGAGQGGSPAGGQAGQAGAGAAGEGQGGAGQGGAGAAGAGQGGGGQAGEGQAGGGAGGSAGGGAGGGAGGAQMAFKVRLFEPPEKQLFALPLGMNASGVVVGYAGPEPWAPLAKPVKTQGDALVVLDVPEANFGFAHGVGPDGTVAGEFAREAHVWAGGVRKKLLSFPGYFSAVARGVNASGLIVGSFADYDDVQTPPFGSRPCTWPNAAALPVVLPPLDPEQSVGVALAVNDAGQIIGSAGTSEGFVAVRWDGPAAAPAPLGMPPEALSSEARGINSLGDAVGRAGYADSTARAFLHRKDTAQIVALKVLGAGYNEALGINTARDAVGAARVGTEVRAALWRGDEVYDLNDLLKNPDPRLVRLSAAVAIDDAGRIAAEAVVAGDGPGEPPRWIALLEPL